MLIHLGKPFALGQAVGDGVFPRQFFLGAADRSICQSAGSQEYRGHKNHYQTEGQ